MTLDELGAMLDKLLSGGRLCISYDQFTDLFPPGEPDEGARKAASAFAHQHGCQIENHPDQHELCFVKDA